MPVAFDARIAVGSIQRSSGDPGAAASGIEPQAVEGIANTQLQDCQLARRLHAQEHATFRSGSWRSVGSSQNAFFMESYVDEMAHAAGKDPYQFRRKLCWRTGPISSACSTRSPRKAIGASRCRQGRGRGIAIHECYGTIVGAGRRGHGLHKGEVQRRIASSPPSIAATWSIRLIVEAQMRGRHHLRTVGRALRRPDDQKRAIEQD